MSPIEQKVYDELIEIETVIEAVVEVIDPDKEPIVKSCFDFINLNFSAIYRWLFRK